jgi:hypothetical protein
MPKYTLTQDEFQQNIKGATGTFVFSAIKPEALGASEYTLVTLAIDITGSVYDFKDALRNVLLNVAKACGKNERSENLLLRVVTFNDDIGVSELHGFKELHQIDPNAYPHFNPNSGTPLFDAVFSSISATLQYAETLKQNDFGVNGAVYIVTDGDDNASVQTKKSISNLLKDVKIGEKIESLITVLIGLHDPALTGNSRAKEVERYLEDFQKESGLTQFVNVGAATAGKLAKLAEFVSKSISSQSTALGTGAPSQPISVTF